MQNLIVIDTDAVNKHVKAMKMSGYIRLGIALASLIGAAFLLGLWFSFVAVLVNAVVWGLMFLGTLASITHLDELVQAIKDGEVSVEGIAKQVGRKENEVRQELRDMIKLGILPGAVVRQDMLVPDINTPPIPMNAQQFEAVKPEQLQQPEIIPAERIDLNTATEEDFAKLPGVGVARAKRAAALRAQHGCFSSVSDFSERVGLKPRHAAQMENFAFAEPPSEEPPTPTENKGRVLDI